MKLFYTYGLQLVAVLREVKYLLIRNMEEIPASASDLYANNDTLLMYVAHLDLTVAWYNKIRETVLEVEYPIIEEQLQAIDTQLLQGEQSFDWQSDGKITTTTVKHFSVSDAARVLFRVGHSSSPLSLSVLFLPRPNFIPLLALSLPFKSS